MERQNRQEQYDNFHLGFREEDRSVTASQLSPVSFPVGRFDYCFETMSAQSYGSFPTFRGQPYADAPTMLRYSTPFMLHNLTATGVFLSTCRFHRARLGSIYLSKCAAGGNREAIDIIGRSGNLINDDEISSWLRTPEASRLQNPDRDVLALWHSVYRAELLIRSLSTTVPGADEVANAASDLLLAFALIENFVPAVSPNYYPWSTTRWAGGGNNVRQFFSSGFGGVTYRGEINVQLDTLDLFKCYSHLIHILLKRSVLGQDIESDVRSFMNCRSYNVARMVMFSLSFEMTVYDCIKAAPEILTIIELALNPPISPVNNDLDINLSWSAIYPPARLVAIADWVKHNAEIITLDEFSRDEFRYEYDNRKLELPVVVQTLEPYIYRNRNNTIVQDGLHGDGHIEDRYPLNSWFDSFQRSSYAAVFSSASSLTEYLLYGDWAAKTDTLQHALCPIVLDNEATMFASGFFRDSPDTLWHSADDGGLSIPQSLLMSYQREILLTYVLNYLFVQGRPYAVFPHKISDDVIFKKWKLGPKAAFFAALGTAYGIAFQ